MRTRIGSGMFGLRGIASTLSALALMFAAAFVAVSQASAPALQAAAATPAHAPRGDLDFTPLTEHLPASDVQLVNGQEVVDPTIWSSVVIARSIDGSLCTATLVGPRTLLTAAHCVDAYGPPTTGDSDGIGTRKGKVSFSGSPIPILSCTMHPDYASVQVNDPALPRSSADYALCELARDVPGVVYETMDMGGNLTTRASVLMTGYGCTDIGVENDEIVGTAGEGTLRLGIAVIDAFNAGSAAGLGSTYLRIRSRGVEPVLCPGDSGGPALTGATVAQRDPAHRRVVAVNSMVEAVRQGSGYVYLSYLAPLGTGSFRQFQQAWSAKASTRQVCSGATAPMPANCRL